MGLRTLLPLFFLVFSFTAQAQTYGFRHFGMEKGQFPSRLNCLAQTENGKLWAGTMAGLVSYDGHEFETISEVDGLAENWVTCMTENNGNLWVGHWAGGISKINLADNDIEIFPTQEAFSYSPVSDLLVMDDRSLIVATEGKGLFLWEPGEVPERIFINSEKHVLNIRCLLRGPQGQLWIASNEGVYHTGRNGYRNREPWTKAAFSEVGISAECLYLSSSGEVLAGTAKGVWVYHDSNFIEVGNPELSQEHITAIAEVNDERWFATPENGAWSCNEVTGEVRHFTVSNGLGYNKVRDIIADREGNIWIATIAGLDQFTGNAFTLYSSPQHLPASLTWDVQVTPQGILCGTAEGMSLLRFSGPSIVMATHFYPFGNASNDIVDVLYTTDERVFAINRDGRVVVFPLANPEKVSHPFDGKMGFAHCAYQSSDGRIWIGTQEGVTVQDTNGEIWSMAREDGLGGNIVNRIFQTSDGRMWFALLGGSLTSYHNGRLKAYGQNEGFRSRLVQTFAEGPHGELLVGTYDHGLYILRNNQILQMTARDGLSSNSIYALAADPTGNIWIGHNWGLDKLNLNTMEVDFLGKGHGFMGVEVNADAMDCDAKGNIIAGTLLGIQVLDPREIRQNLVEPTLFFTGFSAMRKPMDLRTDTLLEPSQNEVSFRFSAISLMDPDAVTYSYKLEGIDQDWAVTERVVPVTYTNLPPGDYVFQVKASNANGIWTSTPKTVHFAIAAPFYRTWWFYVALFIMGVAAIFFVDKLRSVSLIDAKNVLENKLQQRNQELVELNTELEFRESRFSGQLKEASKVQKALLADNAEGMTALRDCFILSRSKELVTSDILFVRRNGEKLVVALFDSHAAGISGTFISMFAHYAMERAISEFKLEEPGEMMEKMNELLYERLERMDEQSKIAGLKSVICSIDLETKKHRFAGGGSSIYHLQRTANTPPRITEYQSSVEVIGKHAKLENLKVQSVDPGPDDVFYIMTDGFIGQFGGATGKKFNKGRLKDLLTEYAGIPFGQQKERLNSAFEEWKGEMEQMDDFCIIGWKA